MGVAEPTTENTLSQANLKYARIERERKFVLEQMPEGLARNSAHVQIWDLYLTDTRLRLRKVRVPETKAYILKLTQKFPLNAGDFSRCVITNTYLSAREYNRLAQSFEALPNNEIRKNRYRFEHDGRSYAIDWHLGNLWGLITAETEFVTDEEMETFTPPFLAREITQERPYTGGELCKLSLAELTDNSAKKFARLS